MRKPKTRRLSVGFTDAEWEVINTALGVGDTITYNANSRRHRLILIAVLAFCKAVIRQKYSIQYPPAVDLREETAEERQERIEAAFADEKAAVKTDPWKVNRWN